MSDKPQQSSSGQSQPQARADEPYIPASQSLPEITLKAILLAIVLSMVLAGANAYLGLKAGMTVSASIPAAVISMALLRLFKNSNILENNIVQTAASAGESLAAGVIFTLPALVLLGAWEDFDFWETTMIAGLGGLLGVTFTIPLRRALIVESPLKFPEGVATAEVLKVGDKGGEGIKRIIAGGLAGAVFKIGDTGLKLWKGAVEGGAQIGNTIGYVGTNTAPALLAVGYIVGINIAVLVFLGGAINWYGAVPIVAQMNDWPVYQSAEAVGDNPDWNVFTVEPGSEKVGEPVEAAEYAGQIWSAQTRYLGVGAMVVGGLWALIRLWGSLVAGVRSSVRAYRAIKQDGSGSMDRTDRDTPIQLVGIVLVVAVIPLYFVFEYATGSFGIAAVMAVVMLVAGFLFSAVASYMAGLVGSSNNPISGVTIATLLTSAILLYLLGMTTDTGGAAAAIFIGGVVACAAAIGGDNMQDLKAGRIVGATPYKQQIMQAIGVVSAAVIMAPVLTALLKAYGIGPISVEGQEPLQAPQATLMESVARGVFAWDLPWTLVFIGMAIAALVIMIDLVLEAKNTTFRMPVLAVAVGIYLPLELSVPILVGGLVSFAAHRFHMRRISREAEGELKNSLMETKKRSERNGLLMAAGLITGEALLGILLAIPLAAWQGQNKIAEWFNTTTGLENLWWPGLALLAVIIIWLYRVARGPTQRPTV